MRCLALIALLAATPVAGAAELCDGQPCSVSMEFPAGGTITASSGTIAFGSGGVLALGEGGSITPGEGGSITPEPAAGAAPDMSNGGSIVFGSGGQIVFGAGGSLATGDAGMISIADSPGSAFAVANAGSIAISSDASIFVGDIDSEGTVEMTAAGSVNGCDPGTPIHLAAIDHDPSTRISITSGGDIAMGTIKGSPESLTVTAQRDITLCSEGAWEPGGGTDGGSGYGASGLCVDSGSGVSCSGTVSQADPTVPAPEHMYVMDAFVSPGDGGGGAPAPLMLLALGLGALLRRVQDPNG